MGTQEKPSVWDIQLRCTGAEDERDHLHVFVRRGKANARTRQPGESVVEKRRGLDGRRCVELTEQRTRLDFAQTIRWLVDEVYLEARVIRLVMDNLNTHTAASLYEAFPPEEAQRIWQRLEVHYTPKHGS